MPPQSHFGVVSISSQNHQNTQESEQSALAKKLTLPAKPAKSSENPIDRTIVPQFGKNDLIIRQVKNPDTLQE